ncbi:sugar ABC transporter substrate-binding protein [Spirochaetia bacterium]|nr:sugar ABC transporter substrate-binding protein [Spirochaetia bacterium]
MIKKFSVLLVLTVLALTLGARNLFAKGGGEKSDGSGTITLRFAWWGSDARHKATLAAIDKYQQLHPNIRIEGEYSAIDTYYSRLVTQFSGGTAPDIIQIDYPWITDFAAQGNFLENFNDYKNLVDLSKFDASYLQGWCMNGNRLEGIPFALNGYTMFYNKKAVDMAGIDLNTDSKWSWDKLVSEGEKFAAKYPDYIFLHSDPQTLEKNIFKPYLIQTYGGEYINSDLTLPFGRPNLVQTYRFMLSLLDKKLIQSVSDTAAYDGKIDQNPIWANGKAALCIRWTSDISQLMNSNVEILTARLPVITGSTDTAINTKPSMLATVYSGSKYKEEAFKFINWIILETEALDIVTDVRGVPAAASSRDYLASKNKLNPALVQAVAVAAANAGSPQNGYNDNAEITSISTDILMKLLYKQISPEQAADEYLQRVGDKLKSMK